MQLFSDVVRSLGLNQGLSHGRMCQMHRKGYIDLTQLHCDRLDIPGLPAEAVVVAAAVMWWWKMAAVATRCGQRWLRNWRWRRGGGCKGGPRGRAAVGKTDGETAEEAVAAVPVPSGGGGNRRQPAPEAPVGGSGARRTQTRRRPARAGRGELGRLAAAPAAVTGEALKPGRRR